MRGSSVITRLNLKMDENIVKLTERLSQERFSEKSSGLEELLLKAGFTNVRSALHNLKLLSEHSATSPTLLRKIVARAAESFDPDSALNNMERFLSAPEDRGALCGRLEGDAETVTALMTLFSGSQLLTDAFLQMSRGLDFPAFSLPKGAGAIPVREVRTKEKMWEELSVSLAAARTLEDSGRLVRAFKKREYIRIGLHDLLKTANTVETIRDLSTLADVCLEAAYASCHQELVKRCGPPIYIDTDGQEKECRFSILGLGKLGGLELNFSSDIDILYLYSSDDGSTVGVPGPGESRVNKISNHEYFSRLGAMITNFMSEITPEGNIFRVDLRLRPEGRMGDIAYSLRSYEIYYESYGVTLERQALIKTRVCAGDMELGQRFIRTVKPFIYRKHLDHTAIEEIKQMKEAIDRRLRHERKEEGHVKLGYGGIREIEFVIQAFQLVYGGRDDRLQRNNSIQALESLYEARYLNHSDYSALRDAYLFLRDLENRLQISHGLQTHSLPGDERMLAVLARKMGMSGDGHRELADKLMREYSRHVETVRGVYNDLFYSSVKTREAQEIFLDLEDRDSALSRLTAAGFSLPERALDNLLLFRDGPLFSHPTEHSKMTFSRLVPNLIRLLSSVPDPDMALNHLERFANSSRSRGTLLSLFLEEEQLLDLLTRLFGASEILSRILLQQPKLLDTLLQREEMVPFKSRDRFQADFLRALQPVEGWEEKLTELRKYKQAEDLRVGLKYILRSQDIMETVAELSNLAEAVLRVALVMAEGELMPKYGMPTTRDGEKSRLTIIGMGKLGGREMSFGSDLDILIVFSGDGHTAAGTGSHHNSESVPNHIYYTRLYEELLNAVSAVTAGGYAYKIDMRLRPEGDKGSLALPLNKFSDYFIREEQAWVRQAMIKARPVAGDMELGGRFMEAAHRFTYGKEFGRRQAEEIAHNRARMEKELAREVRGQRDLKHGLGGITDIEFAVQLLQLKHGCDHPKIRSPGTLNALNELVGESLISQEEHRYLQEAYLFLRQVELNLRIVEERPVHALPRSSGEQDKLARRLGVAPRDGQREGRMLMVKYERLTTGVREIYEKIVRRTMG